MIKTLAKFFLNKVIRWRFVGSFPEDDKYIIAVVPHSSYFDLIIAVLIRTYSGIKIKFIDMRGKIDNQLSIEGDYLYDWAKLYQSFIGYDKILMNKNINIKYEEKMKKIFEDYFIELYDKDKLKDLKIITKSLLFTLIPLHHNEKCFEYYKLIFSKYLI